VSRYRDIYTYNIYIYIHLGWAVSPYRDINTYTYIHYIHYIYTTYIHYIYTIYTIYTLYIHYIYSLYIYIYTYTWGVPCRDASQPLARYTSRGPGGHSFSLGTGSIPRRYGYPHGPSRPCHGCQGRYGRTSRSPSSALRIPAGQYDAARHGCASAADPRLPIAPRPAHGLRPTARGNGPRSTANPVNTVNNGQRTLVEVG
jgi:hypothetical protein